MENLTIIYPGNRPIHVLYQGGYVVHRSVHVQADPSTKLRKPDKGLHQSAQLHQPIQLYIVFGQKNQNYFGAIMFRSGLG